MCGRYWIENNGDENDTLPGVKTSGEVVPGDTVAALCFSRAGHVRPFAMKWGWQISGKLVINARIETAPQKQAFADSCIHRRCLLPAAAYFEWHKRGRDKIKYRIAPRGSGVYYLAGLYRWENEIPVFTILTTDAAEEIDFIHRRMPVIISESESRGWLTDEKFQLPKAQEMDYRLAI